MSDGRRSRAEQGAFGVWLAADKARGHLREPFGANGLAALCAFDELTIPKRAGFSTEAKVKPITLEDGSRIHLNACGRAYSKDQRRLKLLREARGASSLCRPS